MPDFASMTRENQPTIALRNTRTESAFVLKLQSRQAQPDLPDCKANLEADGHTNGYFWAGD